MRAYRRLRLRMLAVCALSTALVLAGMAAASYLLAAGQLRAQYEQTFSSTVSSVHAYLREQPAISHGWLLQTERDAGLLIGVESGRGYRLYAGLDPDKDALTAAALRAAVAEHGFDAQSASYGDWRSSGAAFHFDGAGVSWRAAVNRVPVGNRWLTVTVLGDRSDELGQMAGLRLRFAAATAVALLCLTAFAWGFSGWATRPAAESQRRQVAFVGAASHEFRSPVAVIRMAAENLEGAQPEDAERFRRMILRECGRLGRLTGDMLQLAGADGRSLSVRIEPVNPESPLLCAWESFQELAVRGGVALELDLPAQPLPRLRCDRERVEQLLAILLDNALRHTPEHGRVVLGLRRERGAALFTVSDTGPGIPDSEKERVFERFYRGDAARSDKERYGLGLAVAREIAALHGGSLRVQDAPGGGSLFVLTLPLTGKGRT